MGRFILVIGLVTLTTVLAGKDKPKTEWVTLPCMSRLIINDFGKCTQTGSHYHCPNTSTDFDVECVSVERPVGLQSQQMHLTHPTAIEVEKP